MSEPELPLPDGKTSFKPEELYRFTKVKPFVLRFWESEFPFLTPKKAGSAGLTYSRADVEMILSIKQLLYDEGLTLAEARGRLFVEEDQEGKQKTGRTAGTKKRKAKTVAGKPAATSNGSGRARKAQTAGAGAAAASRPGKAQDKRGLPGKETSRNTVSFEDLLPDSTGSEDAAGPDRSPSPDPPAIKSAATAEKKLSVALVQLRELLTFLDNGDR